MPHLADQADSVPSARWRSASPCRLQDPADGRPSARRAPKRPRRASIPDKMVEEIWAPRSCPISSAKAGPFAEVAALAEDRPDGGRRQIRQSAKKQAQLAMDLRRSGSRARSSRPTRQSRAATIDVDVDGDGKADARVQIGPAMRGTALRDSLDFVYFNDFTNQIDFAQFGKAFNQPMSTRRCCPSPAARQSSIGRHGRRSLGAYHARQGGQDLPLVTPAASRRSGRRHERDRPMTSC